MFFAFLIPETVWGSVAGALLGSLLATGVVAYLTQWWIEGRELRNRRDQSRLELYLEVIDLVLDNELAIAQRGSEGSIASIELQTQRLRISHRLILLGPQTVNDAYNRYRTLVFQETAHDRLNRPSNPDDVVNARNKLLELMASEVRKV